MYVTSLTANANSGENATLSITLTGCGALTKVNATATTNYNYDDGNTSGSNSNTGNSNNNSGNTEEIFIGTSVNDEAMGTVTGMGTYYKGESVTLVARANDGYRFLQWTDDVLDNPRTVTADVNGVIYTAVFEKI